MEFVCKSCVFGKLTYQLSSSGPTFILSYNFLGLEFWIFSVFKSQGIIFYVKRQFLASYNVFLGMSVVDTSLFRDKLLPFELVRIALHFTVFSISFIKFGFY
jgi:hypothetical protein